jgi:hypothetical protein
VLEKREYDLCEETDSIVENSSGRSLKRCCETRDAIRVIAALDSGKRLPRWLSSLSSPLRSSCPATMKDFWKSLAERWGLRSELRLEGAPVWERREYVGFN